MSLFSDKNTPEYIETCNREALARREEFTREIEGMSRTDAFHAFRLLKRKFPFFGLVSCPVGGNEPVMFTVNDDVVAWQFFWLGEYERETLSAWDEVTRSTTTVLDIGAYTGLYSLIAAMNGNHAHAFELTPRTVERAKINVTLNNLSNKITLHPYGLSERSEQVKIFIPRNTEILGTGNAINEKEIWRQRGQTPRTTFSQVRKFSDVLAEGQISSFEAMKVDVEGHEYEVLSSMRDALEEHRPVVIVEISRRRRDEVFQLLAELEYRVEQLHGLDHIAYP